MAHNWQETMTIMVRAFIDDLDESNYTYGDAKIQQLIVVAAKLVKQAISFETEYTIDVGGVDISPDPVENNDDAFLALVSLKTACLILAGEVKLAASQTVKIHDAGAVIDLSGRHKAQKDLYEQLCRDFDKAKTSFFAGNLSNIRAILTPYTVESNPTGIFFG